MNRRYAKRCSGVIPSIYERLANGTFKPLVDSVFPFAQVVEAYKRLESNRQVGKIVITL